MGGGTEDPVDQLFKNPISFCRSEGKLDVHVLSIVEDGQGKCQMIRTGYLGGSGNQELFNALTTLDEEDVQRGFAGKDLAERTTNLSLLSTLTTKAPAGPASKYQKAEKVFKDAKALLEKVRNDFVSSRLKNGSSMIPITWGDERSACHYLSSPSVIYEDVKDSAVIFNPPLDLNNKSTHYPWNHSQYVESNLKALRGGTRSSHGLFKLRTHRGKKPSIRFAVSTEVEPHIMGSAPLFKPPCRDDHSSALSDDEDDWEDGIALPPIPTFSLAPRLVTEAFREKEARAIFSALEKLDNLDDIKTMRETIYRTVTELFATSFKPESDSVSQINLDGGPLRPEATDGECTYENSRFKFTLYHIHDDDIVDED